MCTWQSSRIFCRVNKHSRVFGDTVRIVCGNRQAKMHKPIAKWNFYNDTWARWQRPCWILFRENKCRHTICNALGTKFDEGTYQVNRKFLWPYTRQPLSVIFANFHVEHWNSINVQRFFVIEIFKSPIIKVNLSCFYSAAYHHLCWYWQVSYCQQAKLRKLKDKISLKYVIFLCCGK